MTTLVPILLAFLLQPPLSPAPAPCQDSYGLCDNNPAGQDQPAAPAPALIPCPDSYGLCLSEDEPIVPCPDSYGLSPAAADLTAGHLNLGRALLLDDSHFTHPGETYHENSQR